MMPGREPESTEAGSVAVRHSYTIVGPGLLLVVLFALPAVLPLLTAPSLPLSHDGIHHLHRLVEFVRCLRAGDFFPRWAPDLAFGYGYPIFNYYPYGSYYLPALLHFLGLDFPRALLMAFALYLLAGSGFMYLLGRELWGEAGGVLSGVAYVYAPYALYNVFRRGTLSEVCALALLPLVLWAFRRLGWAGKHRYVLIGSLSLAVFLLMHNIVTLIGLPVLALFAALTVWEIPRHRRGRGILLLLTAALLGLGLSAFFLGPAFFEKDLVQIERDTQSWHADFRRHFLGLSDLLSPPRAEVSRCLQMPDYRGLGWVHLALAFLAMLGVTAGRIGNLSSQTALGVLLVVGAAFLTLPSSAWVWEHVPLLPFVQYPWRFLGLTALGLALLSGGALLVMSPHSRRVTLSSAQESAEPSTIRSRWTTPALAFALLLLVLVNLPLTYPRYYADSFSGLTVADLIARERQSGLLGTTTFGEFLPRAVQEVPKDDFLERAYRDGIENPPRLDADSLPAGSHVLQADYGYNHLQVTLDTPQATLVRFRLFTFPGWQATVDGKPVDVMPSSPHGLIQVPVSAGEHIIEIRFGDTPVRVVSKALSWLSALVWMGVLAYGLRDWKTGRLEGWKIGQAEVRRNKQSFSQSFSLPISHLGLGFLFAFALLLLLFKVVYIDRYDNPLRYDGFDGERVAAASHPLAVNFGRRLVLRGYDLRPSLMASGETLDLTLYWTPEEVLTQHPTVFVDLVDTEGHRYAQHKAPVPVDFPLHLWTPHYYAVDEHALTVPPGTPPGEYTLRLWVHTADAPQGLPMMKDETPQGASYSLATITVARPPHPSQPSVLQMLSPLPAPAAMGPLELLGYRVEVASLRPGDRLPLYVCWRARQAPKRTYTARLDLVDETGTMVASLSFPPGGRDFSTAEWRAGEVVCAWHTPLVPGDVSGGEYTLRLALADRDGSPLGSPVALGTLRVATIPRRWTVPPIQYPLPATLDDRVDFLGYDLEATKIRPGEVLSLTLYWRGRKLMNTDYRVFVHLADATDHPWAQADSVPVQWTRPTTGWAPGEVVVDPYQVTVGVRIPPGEYRLLVGMYDPRTGRRLPVRDAQGQASGDYLELTSVIIGP